MAEEKTEKREERVVRILSKDIEGNTSVYSGLAQIKGISWSFSNAICKKLGIKKTKKIGALTEEEIKKITEFIKNPDIPKHLINRRKDFETGEDIHLVGSDLDLKKEFDVKRLKKIKSYRGYRHMAGLPTRGQRTRSNFRKNRRKGAGIKSKKKK
ncbi:30S ribosomal protein S13 [Candidatus Pacearchaeota archaeon]|nr:MAG: 30S ribosomal protein S13 [Candidatus Pacearchaeota archaeon]